MSSTTPGRSVKAYDLLERIGSGGFGVVFRAYQTTLGREVAVKVVRSEFADNPDFIRRFEAEAQRVARIEHLHVVPLYDYWRQPGGAFLVMRWLRGGSLAEALQTQPFSLTRAADLVDHVGAALSVGRLHQVVHGDLKPTNILLDDEGNAYLADFRLSGEFARLLDQAEAAAGAFPSVAYLSPEQIRGEQISSRSDIYSLGVILYEVLTGKHPFHDATPEELLASHLHDPIPAIKALDVHVRDQVNDVIHRATNKSPRDRYDDVLSMAAEFRHAVHLQADSQAPMDADALTLREQEILQRVIDGQTNRQIADDLVIELSTVKWHIRQAYGKLGVHSRRQAISKLKDVDLFAPGRVAQAGRMLPVEAPPPVNPFRGLRPFESSDSHVYFGQEAMVDRLVAHLSFGSLGGISPKGPLASDGRFVAVVGPSGSGKSSLVKAGLIPALRRGAVKGSERWFFAEMKPGQRPLDELEIALERLAVGEVGTLRQQLDRDSAGLLRAAAIALPDDGSELLLVVDQLEELFVMVDDESIRRRFLDLLVAAVTDPRSRVRVVTTLRADYFDHPLYYEAFAELVQRHLETVLPLSPAELERAIVGPLEDSGVEYAAGLVPRIVDDILNQPGPLPLLQYALTELYERRDGLRLTHSAYESIGGISGAMAERAEGLYQELDRPGQEIVRSLFLRLVSIVPDSGEIWDPEARRRVDRTTLLALVEDEDTMDENIDAYAAYRLLTLDIDPATRQPTVEVAHEALFNGWHRLSEWVAESRDDLLQQQRLHTLVTEWLDSQEEPGFLLRGSRLDRFATWAEGSSLSLTEDEHRFLAASLSAREERRAGEEARRLSEVETAQALADAQTQRVHEQARSNRRLRRLAVGLAFLLLAAGAGALLAWRQTNLAKQQTRLAFARELSAAAVSDLDEDPERSILLALQAAHTTYDVDGSVVTQAVSALHQAVETSRVLYQIQTDGGVEFSPDGKYLATSTDDGATLWDPVTGAKLQDMSDGGVVPTNLSFSADSQSLAGTNPDGQVMVWDVATGAVRLRLAGHKDGALSVAWSPDGRLLASTSFDKTVRVWDAQTGDAVHVFQTADTPAGIDFSPDGGLLAVAIDSTPGEVDIWDPVSGEAKPPLTGYGDGVNDVAFGPNGRYLATASTDGTSVIWDMGDHSRAQTLYHGAWVYGVDFSSDGSRVATGGQDGIVQVWDAGTGQSLLRLAGHKAGVGNVSFSPHGTRLASGGGDHTAMVWDISSAGRGERFNLAAHNDLVFDLAYSNDGTRLATASWDGTAKIWDAATGHLLSTLVGHNDRISHLAFAPDGRRLATASYDGTVREWDVATGVSQLTLDGQDGWVFGVAFSPDGRWLASSDAQGTISIWDANTGVRLRTIDTGSSIVFRVGFSPDSQELVSSGWDGAATLWDPETGTLMGSLVGHTDGITQMTFSPDGKQIATSSFDSTVKLWDSARGEVLRTFEGHTGTVWDVTFNPDGTTLASAGFDGLVKLWDISTGDNSLTLSDGVAGPALAFSPDGRDLAVAGDDGVVRVYAVKVEDLMAIADSRTTRNLTQAECRQYLHEDTCPQSN